jgi:hypothetical protein
LQLPDESQEELGRVEGFLGDAVDARCACPLIGEHGRQRHSNPVVLVEEMVEVVEPMGRLVQRFQGEAVLGLDDSGHTC